MSVLLAMDMRRPNTVLMGELLFKPGIKINFHLGLQVTQTSFLFLYIFVGVLGYLVQELEASALLSLLPSDLPLTLTMPYMERSLLRDRASRLREEIVAAGMESIKGC